MILPASRRRAATAARVRRARQHRRVLRPADAVGRAFWRAQPLIASWIAVSVLPMLASPRGALGAYLAAMSANDPWQSPECVAVFAHTARLIAQTARAARAGHVAKLFDRFAVEDR